MNIRFGTRFLQSQQITDYLVSSMKNIKSMNLAVGDRLALYDYNTVEYALLICCCWHMGVVACPINPKIPLSLAKAYAQRLGAKHFFGKAEIKKAIMFDARQQLDMSPQLPAIPEHQAAVIISTAGSSGEPKPALLTFGQLMANARGAKTVIPLNEEDGWLLSLPFFHISGIAILARCLEARATLVIPVADHLAEDLQQRGVTHLSLVGTQLYRLLQNPCHVSLLRPLKAILLGGSAIAPALLEKALEEKLTIYLSYGLTEMGSQVATGKVVNATQACARLLPYRQLSIAEDGEILVRGETLFSGYVFGQRVHLPLIKQGQHGWFATGDIGALDANGCLRILGRKDNMFICAGENIYPEEIERVLLSVPGIRQALVVSQPDDKYGHIPVAFVDKDPVLTKDVLVSACQRTLPAFKVPKMFLSWPIIDEGFKPSRKTFAGLVGTPQAKEF